MDGPETQEFERRVPRRSTRADVHWASATSAGGCFVIRGGWLYQNNGKLVIYIPRLCSGGDQ